MSTPWLWWWSWDQDCDDDDGIVEIDDDEDGDDDHKVNNHLYRSCLCQRMQMFTKGSKYLQIFAIPFRCEPSVLEKFKAVQSQRLLVVRE